MIAAIASCIFVIYLYRSLNEKEADDPRQEAQSLDRQDLSGRLSVLEARLRVLANDKQGGSSS